MKGTTGSAKKYKNWPWAANLEFLQDTLSNVPEHSEESNIDVMAESSNDCSTDVPQDQSLQKKENQVHQKKFPMTLAS